MFESVYENVIIRSLGLFGALASITALYLYIHDRRRKSLLYRIVTTTIIDDPSKIPDVLRIYALKRRLNRLTVSKIYLWNDATAPVRHEDIAQKDPIRAKVGDRYKIYSANVSYSRPSASGFRCCPLTASSAYPCDVVEIQFDFVDRQGGCIIDVLHDGKEEEIDIYGIIVGGSISTSEFSPEEENRKSALLSIAMVCAYLLLFLFIVIDSGEILGIHPYWSVLALTLLSLILSPIPFFLEIRAIRRKSGSFLEEPQERSQR